MKDKRPTNLDSKPDIIGTISRYVDLRRAGKEYVGHCPFHQDKNPSFSVSQDKQVFHCFGCGESGNVITFTMKFHGLTFAEALAELGISSRPTMRRDNRKRRAAEKVVRWLNQQRELLSDRIRELDEEIGLADEVPDDELAESFWRERSILIDLRGDLSNLEYLPDFLQLKQSIEKISRGEQ